MSVLQKLTEGIVDRNLKKEGAALLEKWEATGLLEGLGNDHQKQGMARLLENQAAQLLKEASAMSSGDVEGFASVAFPIVRRVFGGLIANELISVQPMSLPSGLIFFLDFVYTDNMVHAGANADKSLFVVALLGQRSPVVLLTSLRSLVVSTTSTMVTPRPLARKLYTSLQAPTLEHRSAEVHLLRLKRRLFSSTLML